MRDHLAGCDMTVSRFRRREPGEAPTPMGGTDMTGRHEQRGQRFDRARSQEEPGAHSGAESQAQQRSVPGTASAKEGYQPERGTTAGKPLEGLETEERASQEEDEGGAGGGKSAGR